MRKRYFLGFDGYDKNDRRLKIVDDIFFNYNSSKGSKPIIAITPSAYNIKKKIYIYIVKHSLKTVLTVRKGSVRVKNKNFKSFFNKNFLSYKIEILKKVKGIGEIIVNTDSDEAIRIAKDYGVAFHKRDPYFASSNCSNSEFWAHIAEVTDSDYILFTHCTNPLITTKTYQEFLKIFNSKKNIFDSFNTVTK